MVDHTKPLKTIEDAKAYVEALHAEGQMFHFEDDPDTIIEGKTGKYLFDYVTAAHVSARIEELYSFKWEWGEHECPIGYALHVMGYLNKGEKQ